ncbi:hypothetical protein V8E51_016971 [Hyaloscypha variabilis]
MASTFHIPTELRLLILEYVLTSPSGVITFRCPSGSNSTRIFAEGETNEELFSLSILRRCKQFYGDCEDILWKVNTLDLEPLLSPHLGNTEFLDLIPRLWNNVRSVQLEIGFRGSPSNIIRTTWLESSLEELTTWENLRAISFVVREDFLDCVKAMDGLIQTREGFGDNADGATMNKCLDIFEGAGGKEGYLAHLERKIVFNFEYKPPSGLDWTPAAGTLMMLETPLPDKIFMELATSFGGDVVANGEVYYSNGVQKKRLFYTRLNLENLYTQTVSLAKGCALQKLEFIYTCWTKLEKDEVRKHLLGLTTLQVSEEEGKKIRHYLDHWFETGPKQLVELTKEMSKENPMEIEEQCGQLELARRS